MHVCIRLCLPDRHTHTSLRTYMNTYKHKCHTHSHAETHTHIHVSHTLAYTNIHTVSTILELVSAMSEICALAAVDLHQPVPLGAYTTNSEFMRHEPNESSKNHQFNEPAPPGAKAPYQSYKLNESSTKYGLQHTATHCNHELQHTATHYNASSASHKLNASSVYHELNVLSAYRIPNASSKHDQLNAPSENTHLRAQHQPQSHLQVAHTALVPPRLPHTPFSTTLQHTATHCSTLQRTAAHSSTQTRRLLPECPETPPPPAQRGDERERRERRANNSHTTSFNATTSFPPLPPPPPPPPSPPPPPRSPLHLPPPPRVDTSLLLHGEGGAGGEGVVMGVESVRYHDQTACGWGAERESESESERESKSKNESETVQQLRAGMSLYEVRSHCNILQYTTVQQHTATCYDTIQCSYLARVCLSRRLMMCCIRICISICICICICMCIMYKCIYVYLYLERWGVKRGEASLACVNTPLLCVECAFLV